MNSFIELQNIAKTYQTQDSQVELFDNINVTIEQGKATAIVGASGAGKSTLLLICAGLEQQSTGNVRYVSKGESRSIVQLKQNSGFIFQQFHLLPELNALQNVALPLKLRGDKHAEKNALCWLENVGLGARAKHKPNQLSGGEQQRVAIARSLSTQPEFIFADEPTGNLDEATAATITDLLFDLIHENQTGLVMVTHNTELALRCDNRLNLKQGSLNNYPVEELAYA
ncbi:MAG: ATP-binding cassette domain-containing protein [Alteromonadaceae bacterium]|nr:ATP-binding cassette domain-containing protein [Alteromonadaceae bacterium]